MTGGCDCRHRDLREFIERVAALGDLVRISGPDPALDLGILIEPGSPTRTLSSGLWAAVGHFVTPRLAVASPVRPPSTISFSKCAMKPA